MRETTVAARYAKALFLAAEKRGETARALEQLSGLVPLFGPTTPGGRFLVSPEVRLADKRAVLEQVLGARTLRLLVVFLDLLLRKKRMGELTTIGDEFSGLVERSQGIRRAQVVSAVPLAEAERQRLHQALEKVTGATIKLDTVVDSALIGGALVRIGDRVIDRTVRTLLEAMSRQLYEASV